MCQNIETGIHTFSLYHKLSYTEAQNLIETLIELESCYLMAIGEPTVSTFPAFPPPHTVHESFPSHGVPSIAAQNHYHKLLQEKI